MLRRDRHKVYAADLQQQEEENGDVVSSPTAFSQNGLPGRGSCDAPSPASEGGCLDEDTNAWREGGCVAAGGAFEQSNGEPTCLGAVGPGAEPPVAVAFRAFAHEEARTESVCDRSELAIEQGAEEFPLGSSRFDRDAIRRQSGEEERDGACEALRLHRDERKLFGGTQHVTGSRPASTRTSNEGEADTLPDSFHLSDEYGPDGASTGRNPHDDDDDDGYMNERCESLFVGTPTERRYSRSSRQTKGDGIEPSSRRRSTKNSDDDDSRSRFQGWEEENGGAMLGSVSDNSDRWSSSSERLHRPQQQPQPHLSRRRARQNARRQPLSAMKENSRIAPSEELLSPTGFELEGGRRRRRTTCRGSVKHRSPPPRSPRGKKDCSHHRRGRRGVGGHRDRGSRRRALVETESMCGQPKDELEEEVAKLRRENEELKRQQERTTRCSCLRDIVIKAD